ncbi:S9 family peptidase [Thermomonospora catenispora]|uniref:S9 family peptidase n=1 Tax=Thermomonospora catenispora TaxID=2493090 RepID=UPI00111F34F2|nr:S9 family peptidase [Thermomonospora catenispora]TNY37549.1 S9 family peptidase [Thermomonospora catenispora]
MPEYVDFVPRHRFQPTLALSPDATAVAYSSNVSGSYELWVVPVHGGEPRKVAGLPGGAVRQMAWTPDGKELVFSADRGGDEQYRLYRVPAEGGEPTEISSGGDCQRILPAAPFDATGRLLAYAANDRDRHVQDLVVLDLQEGTERRFIPAPGVAFEPVGFSPDGRWLLSAGFRSHTDIDCYLIDLSDPRPEPVCVRAGRGGGVSDPCAWAPDSTGFYLLTDAWGEFTAVAFYSLTEGTLTPVARPEWDVELLDAGADTLMWSVNQAGRSVLHAHRNGTPVALPTLPSGVITACDVACDGSIAAVLIDAATRPAEIAVLDLEGCRFRYLTDTRPPALQTIEPTEPEMVTYPAGDGRHIHALLYRPSGEGPHPVLLSIHGGPEAQERPTYVRAGLYQYLLARGIAVFAPNIAGSTGYGTAHQRLIYRDWGGIDLHDLDHAVRYLHTLGWVDPDRIAVAGASYGGFAALSCLARLPYQWAAGVSICGPANLLTLAQASPPTWKTFVATVLGDPDTEAERLLARSPVTHADNITAPLYVIQGAQDPRVPQAEADQLVHRLRARGVNVRYDTYPDEGHGFTNRDNEIKAYGEIADFLVSQLR